MPAGWVSAAAAVYGAVSAHNAGNRAVQGARQGAAMDQQTWKQLQGIQSPWTQAGGSAQSALNYDLGLGWGQGRTGYGSLMKPYQGFNYTGQQAPGAFNPTGYKPFTIQDFHNMSPAYEFTREQGGQGVLNQSAANQGALSGAAMKDLMGFNSGLANQSFNNAFGQNMAEQQQRYQQQLGQYQGQLAGYNSQFGNQLSAQQQNFSQYNTQQGNIYHRLMGVSGLGQQAAGQLGQVGTGLSTDTAQGYTNAGTAGAWGQMNMGNTLAGGMMTAANNVPWDKVTSGWGGGGGGDLQPLDTTTWQPSTLPAQTG